MFAQCILLLYFHGVNIKVLIRRLEALEKKVETLEKENSFLKEGLAIYENPKNSRNSSNPPSKDENRPKARLWAKILEVKRDERVRLLK
jgi:hypothetical protein